MTHIDDATRPPANHTFAWLCLIVIALCYAGQIAYAARVLPDPVASHFDIKGRPDHSMSREAHLAFMSILGVGMPGFMLGMTALIRRLPPSLVNIPHREYWLVPERIDEAMHMLRGHMLWLSCGILLFFIGVHQLVIEANLSQRVQLPNGPMIILLAAALTMTVVWLVVLYKRFRIPE